jgi:hypothetical protein
MSPSMDVEPIPTPAELRADIDMLLAKVGRLIDQRERELSNASTRSRSDLSSA